MRQNKQGYHEQEQATKEHKNATLAANFQIMIFFIGTPSGENLVYNEIYFFCVEKEYKNHFFL